MATIYTPPPEVTESIRHIYSWENFLKWQN